MANFSSPKRLIAVDIGNTAWKFGLFDRPALLASGHDFSGFKAPYPYSLTDCRDDSADFSTMTTWLGAILRNNADEPLDWAAASVNRQKTTALLDWLAAHRPNDAMREIRVSEIPAFNPYDAPNTLGADRLLAALAASRLIRGSAALIVDIGTATKIDFLDSNGVFRGGAILPGPETAATSLFVQTDRLPKVGENGQYRTVYPATNTVDAIRAGIHGSLVGAIEYFHRGAAEKTADGFLPILLTGRGAIGLEPELERRLRCGERRTVRTVRDLVLTGIFLSIASPLAKE